MTMSYNRHDAKFVFYLHMQEQLSAMYMYGHLGRDISVRQHSKSEH